MPTPDTKQTVFTLMGTFDRVVRLAGELEKRPRDFGTGEKLYSSEIQIVEVLGETEGLSVTDLSRMFGITKGAVSQTLKKMVAKELVLKTRDPRNASRFLLSLTAKGKAAFFAHMHWHEKVDGGFRKTLYQLDPEKIRFMTEFLETFEAFLVQRLQQENGSAKK